MPSIEQSFRWIQLGYGIYWIVTAAGFLEAADRYSDSGIESPAISQLQYRSRWVRHFFNRLFSTQKKLRYVCGIQFMLAVLLVIFAIRSTQSLIVITGLLIGGILTNLRHHSGYNGADDLSLVVGIALLWGFAVSSKTSQFLALAFIAAHTILAYAISGVLKLTVSAWRNGTFLHNFADAQLWVHPTFARLLDKYPWLSKAGWGVILFETTFIIIIFLPTPAVIGFLIVGVVFHILNAFIMGISRFLYIYTTSYIAVYSVSTRIPNLLF